MIHKFGLTKANTTRKYYDMLDTETDKQLCTTAVFKLF